MKSLCLVLFSTIVLFNSQANADIVNLFGTDLVNDNTLIIDRSTGQSTVLGPTGFGVSALAYDSNNNRLFGYSPNAARLIEIDLESGAGTAVGTQGAGQVSGLAFDPNTDQLYGIQNSTNSLFVFDRSTGGVTDIANLSQSQLNGLAFDLASNKLFTFDDLNDRIATIDPTTGNVTTLGPLGGPNGGRIAGLDFDPSSGALLGIEILSDQLVEINTTTGAVSPIGGSGLNGIVTLAAVSVPEPSGVVVLALSLGLLWIRRQRDYRSLNHRA